MPRRNASRRGARDYSDVPLPSVRRSAFDRSYIHTTTFNGGELIPVDREEVLPGDSITIQPAVFARITTMEVPIFSNVFCDLHYFAVPLRLIWENSEEFFGAEPGGPGTRVDQLTPKLDISTTPVAEMEVGDYLGIPPGYTETTSALQPHVFYHRAYNLIFSEWFRDAELDALPTLSTSNTSQPESDFPVRRRRKQRDRFTSARPWPQRGPDVNIPLGSTAPVISDGTTPNFSETVGGTLTTNADFQSQGGAGYQTQVGWTGTVPNDLIFGDNTGLQADLSSAAAASVQDLRLAVATQHLFEMFSRAGSARYTELLHTVYGVRSPDQRQQRPEFLGSVSTRLYVNPVASTNDFGTTPGGLGAFGVAAGVGRPFTYSSTEHAVILGIASIRTEYLYAEGLDKDFSRHDRFDYHWPVFEGVGEQPILNKELYVDGSATDQLVFGYEPKYQEYRERHNRVSGRMRPQSASTLAYWHLGQLFGTHQNLNTAFIEENPPFDRVTTLATTVEPTFKVDLYCRERAVRPLSAAGYPGLMRL